MLRLGISACLLGERVRWNAGHKREAYLTDVVGPHVEWFPFCPEDAVMGTPRPTIRLERVDDSIRARGEGGDVTDALAETVPQDDVHGIILKKASPSCGPDVAVWQEGKPSGRSPGIVAARLLERDIPVTDEGRLREPMWREHFFDQAFCWLRWEQRKAGAAGLQAWHAVHKLTLMAHDPNGAKTLGQLAADGDEAGYREALPRVLAAQATRGRHANVLQHIQGYVSDHIDGHDRQEIVDHIAAYQAGNAPLVQPLVLLQHHARKHAPAWLRQQTYLDPYPAEWALRA